MLKDQQLTNCNECLGTGRAKRYEHFAGFEYLYFVNCNLCKAERKRSICGVEGCYCKYGEVEE